MKHLAANCNVTCQPSDPWNILTSYNHRVSNKWGILLKVLQSSVAKKLKRYGVHNITSAIANFILTYIKLSISHSNNHNNNQDLNSYSKTRLFYNTVSRPSKQNLSLLIFSDLYKMHIINIAKVLLALASVASAELFRRQTSTRAATGRCAVLNETISAKDTIQQFWCH